MSEQTDRPDRPYRPYRPYRPDRPDRPDRLVRLSVDGPVATVTFDRPGALNAITPAMLDQLTEAFRAVAPDDSVRVAVLTGRGGRSAPGRPQGTRWALPRRRRRRGLL